MRNESLVAGGIAGVSLRVDFVWRDDRYGHVISAMDADGVIVPLLESREGSKVDSYPASPPFQSLSVENLADRRRAALLVGMAGRSHWSGSVEPLAGAAGMVFDIACRVGESNPLLGSQYVLVPEDQRETHLTSDDATVELQIGKHRLAVAKASETVTCYDRGPQRLTLRPAQNGGAAGGQTVRWKYEIWLLPG